MSKNVGFSLPRAVKSIRVTELIKEMGYFHPPERYAAEYRERYNENVSLATVSATLYKMRKPDLNTSLAEVLDAIKGIPEDKLAVLVMVSEKYGAKAVLSVLKTIQTEAA